MRQSNQGDREDEDDTGLDIQCIEDSIHLDLEIPNPVFEPQSAGHDADETGGDIFPELVYIEDDDSRTTFDFSGIRDRPDSQLKTP